MFDGWLDGILSYSVSAAAPLAPSLESFSRSVFDGPAENADVRVRDLIFLTIPAAIAIKVLRVVLTRAVFDPATRSLGLRTESRRRKLSEQLWFLFLYMSLVVLALAVLPGMGFLEDVRGCWREFPFAEPPRLRLYYVIEIGFYLAALYDHVLVDVRRNDYYAMLVHHIATIVLMGLSYYHGFSRVGALIVALHDVADVTVAATKASHYLDWEYTSIACFSSMLISWAITRLYVFPTRLIYSAYAHPGELGVTVPFHSLYIGLLSVLFVLHVYWFALFLRMAATIVLSGEACDDVRSDSEDEDYHVEKKKRI